MNTQVLKQKIRALGMYKALDQETVKRFGEIVASLGDWDLYRINPISFAGKYGLDERKTLDTFIHAVKLGLFCFEWNLMCPLCGGIIHSEHAIGSINRADYHCATCDWDTETDLSDYVEVAFTVDPSLKKLGIDPYRSMNDYHRYFYSGHHHMPPKHEQYVLEKGFKAFVVIDSGEAGLIRLDTGANDYYRVISADNNALLKLTTTAAESAAPQIADIDITPAGFSPDVLNIPHGTVTLKIHNHLNKKVGVMTNYIDYDEIMGNINEAPPWDDPFLTGKALLNNQNFRDLFRIQTLPNDLKLKVSNITILFTDLKGSTELYDKTGDMAAYNLVQEHFEILKDSTRQHSGAIVKTIGDAIMASFSTPLDAIQAALEMIGEIGRLNERFEGHSVAIKVGLHSGTALAVTANDALDYFGQTVNIAARVQGLADGGEIWVTEPVFKTRGFRKLMGDMGFSFDMQSAILKGVSKPVTVYKCCGAEGI